MTKTLQLRVEDLPLIEEREKANHKEEYNSFAELYMEKPSNIKAYISPSACTWRGFPTIDDW